MYHIGMDLPLLVVIVVLLSGDKMKKRLISLEFVFKKGTRFLIVIKIDNNLFKHNLFLLL